MSEPASDDIVARLRWAEANDPLVAEAGYHEDLSEAAGEIERLRELIAGYEDAASKADEARRPRLARSVEEALHLLEAIGLPALIRPTFTLGNQFVGVARDLGEFERIVAAAIDVSPIGEVLIDRLDHREPGEGP